MTRTKHDCGGPVFGRKTPGCPRCDELLAGEAPRGRYGDTLDTDEAREAEAVRVSYERQKKRYEDQRSRDIRNHNCARSNCGPVCTRFDW